jgi:3-oxoacyl-[acyl-carrier protein] reductase
MAQKIKPLAGQVALVTGAGRGIGEAIANRLAQLGAQVAVSDIDPKLSSAVAQAIQTEGGEAVSFPCDVAKPALTDQLVLDLVAEFGRLDILINNAGICPRIPIEQMTEANFDNMINVNLKSVFFLSRAAAEVMKKQGSGRIVNLASTAARIGGIVDATVYGATKAGIVALTKAMARHYAPDVLINSVAPGPTETRLIDPEDEAHAAYIEQVPLKRMATTDEVAQVVAFLCMEASSFMTGATVDVNGGAVMV